MTPDEYRVSMARLRLSQARLGRMLGVDKGTPSRWASGASTVPGSVALLLRSMVAGYVTPDQLERMVDAGGTPEAEPTF